MLCSIENDERHPSPRAAVLLAKALEIPKISRRPAPKLTGKNALLIDRGLWMKNSSHLMGRVSLLAAIMQTAPGIQLLVTSRERLSLHGEWVFEVEGLPDPVSPEGSSLEWVVRIYQLTEGIPLGIELASAWVRALSCQEIAKEIENSLDFLKTSTRDIPERHRSLRTALDHSGNLLSAQEKKNFCDIVHYELNSPLETRRVVRNRSAQGHTLRTCSRACFLSNLRPAPSLRW